VVVGGARVCACLQQQCHHRQLVSSWQAACSPLHRAVQRRVPAHSGFRVESLWVRGFGLGVRV
jgi:hypothetical protein